MNKKILSIIVVAVLCAATVAQEKRYGIERAIIKKSSEMMGQKVTTILYIDEYGVKELSEMTIEMQGQKLTQITLIKDGYAYNANLTFNQGAKIKLDNVEDLNSLNFLNLNAELKQKYQIVEKGAEELLGRKCDVYEMTYTEQGMSVKSTVWIWKGIPLKTMMSVMGNSIVDEVTEILEGVKIDKEKFEIPKGVDFMEVNM